MPVLARGARQELWGGMSGIDVGGDDSFGVSLEVPEVSAQLLVILETEALVASRTSKGRAYAFTAAGWDQAPTQPEA